MKSAVLLAGLYAEGETTVVEPLPTRDHTERLLERAGATRDASTAERLGRARQRPPLREVEIPGDFSSAAALLVAAVIVPGSDVTVHGVGLNPRRTGLLDVLERMGARVAIYNRRLIGGEPAGDVEVRASELVGATVTPAEVPALVDELPLLALAACHARGETVVRGASRAARQGVGSDRGRRRGAAPDRRRTSARRPTASGSAASRLASAEASCDAVETTGWRCSARLRASSSREGVDLRGAEAVGRASPASSTSSQRSRRARS